jgi:hypothetical protein
VSLNSIENWNGPDGGSDNVDIYLSLCSRAFLGGDYLALVPTHGFVSKVKKGAVSTAPFSIGQDLAEGR